MLSDRRKRKQNSVTLSDSDPAQAVSLPQSVIVDDTINRRWISEKCLVCDNDINRNSVLFHCECIVVFCQQCALYQIAAQRDTYQSGILCPYCRQPSSNIRGIDKCKEAENKLINNAIFHYKLRVSRNDDGIRKALNCLSMDGFVGSISKDEVQTESDLSLNPSVRLELARLEYLREARAAIIDVKDDPEYGILPLGPIKHLTFTRNTILEHAIEIQRENRQDSSSTNQRTERDSLRSNSTISSNMEMSEFLRRKPRLLPAGFKDEFFKDYRSDDENLSNDMDGPSDDDAIVCPSLISINNQENFKESSESTLQPRKCVEDIELQVPIIPRGAKVSIIGGNLSGLVCTTIGYLNSGKCYTIFLCKKMLD